MEMTWEQKFAAIIALTNRGDCVLHMVQPGEWYISTGGSWISDAVMRTTAGGSGRTPQEAVEDTWDRMTTRLSADECVAIYDASGHLRREVRWNGFMWADHIR